MSENNPTPEWLNAVVQGGTGSLYSGAGCDSRLAEPLSQALRRSWRTGIAAADLLREIDGLTAEQLLAFAHVPCNHISIVWDDGDGGLWGVGETYGYPLWLGREFLLENPNRKPDAPLSVIEREAAEERGGCRESRNGPKRRRPSRCLQPNTAGW